MALFGGGVVGGATVKLFLDDSQFKSHLAMAEGETRAASGTMGKFATAAKAAFAVAGVAVAAFAVQSLKAFMHSEEVMGQFQVTLSHMPQLAGETTQAFEDQAHALQNLTGYQDEEIISADTILARFKLTGEQIREVIPTVLDFARASGRDVPAAAEAIGKALLGNTRALKDVGIEFTRTGDTAKDFNSILDLMQSKVAGSAEEFGTTLAGKMEIANAKLDDFKESVGAFIGSELLLLTGDLSGAASMWVQVADATDEANAALYQVAVTAGLNGSAQEELTAKVREYGEFTGMSAAETNALIDSITTLTPAQVAARTEMQHTTAAVNDEAAAHRNAASAALAHRTAELSLAGGLVGVQAAASQLHDAQADLNALEAEGKTGTNAYTQAQSAAYQAFLSLNAAVNDYQSKTRSATGATDQGRGALALMAQSLGIAQGDLASFLGTTNAALAKQLAFNAALNATPRDIQVNVHTTYTQSGNPTTKGPS
jgi:hypothetical protein